jgi:molybdopterin-synthase adenylyltransferase
MNSTDPNLADRDIRQRDLVPPAEVARCHAVVIGVGSIGRQVAVQLAATGVPMMTLYDPDTVGPENLAPQGFWETDVGDPKVHAAANVCHQQFPRMELYARQERFRRSASRAWPADRVAAVFCCVDAIATRKFIWDVVRSPAGFFADGRMAAEVVHVLASGEPAVDKTYPATLFASGDAYVGSCTSKSTIYAASVAAGLMVGQFARWLRGQPVIPDQMLNLLAAELSVSEPVP